MTDRIEALAHALAGTAFPRVVETPAGPVAVKSMEIRSHGAVRWVEVTVSAPAGGDPLFRLFNPPVGDDPVCEVAHAVALHGGRRK